MIYLLLGLLLIGNWVIIFIGFSLGVEKIWFSVHDLFALIVKWSAFHIILLTEGSMLFKPLLSLNSSLHEIVWFSIVQTTAHISSKLIYWVSNFRELCNFVRRIQHRLLIIMQLIFRCCSSTSVTKEYGLSWYLSLEHSALIKYYWWELINMLLIHELRRNSWYFSRYAAFPIYHLYRNTLDRWLMLNEPCLWHLSFSIHSL